MPAQTLQCLNSNGYRIQMGALSCVVMFATNPVDKRWLPNPGRRISSPARAKGGCRSLLAMTDVGEERGVVIAEVHCSRWKVR